jgi:hypothetical protein
MFAHIIIYFVLAALSVTVAYAASTPVSRSSQEQAQAVEEEKDRPGSL